MTRKRHFLIECHTKASHTHTHSQKGVQDWAMSSCFERGRGSIKGVTWLINMHTKMAKRAGQVSQSQNAAAASGQKAPKVQKVVGFKGGFFFGGEKGFSRGGFVW